MKETILHIAGHYLQVEAGERLAANYDPFRAVSVAEGEAVICWITCGEISFPEGTPCETSCLDRTEKLSVGRTPDGGYLVTVHVWQGACYRMYAAADWSRVVMDLRCMEPDCPLSVVNKFLMLSFIYASARRQTVLLHASCVKRGNGGVAFIGHSGAGKSTHSRLWLQHIAGTRLLNDDQPAIRVEADGTIRVYGTPWSGKTHCYRAESALLKGVFRMVQAPHNRLIPLQPVYLFRELLSSCSMMKSDPVTFRLITSTLAKISSQVPGFLFENLPERDAAMMAFSRIKE